MLITLRDAAIYFNYSERAISRAIIKHQIKPIATLARVIPHASYNHIKALQSQKLYKLDDLIKVIGDPTARDNVIELKGAA